MLAEEVLKGWDSSGLVIVKEHLPLSLNFSPLVHDKGFHSLLIYNQLRIPSISLGIAPLPWNNASIPSLLISWFSDNSLIQTCRNAIMCTVDDRTMQLSQIPDGQSIQSEAYTF